MKTIAMTTMMTERQSKKMRESDRTYSYLWLMLFLITLFLACCDDINHNEHRVVVRVVGLDGVSREEVSLKATYPTSADLVHSVADSNGGALLQFKSYTQGDDISIYVIRGGSSVGQLVVSFPGNVFEIHREAKIGRVLEYDAGGKVSKDMAY